MNKVEFIKKLKKELSKLPRRELKERLNFYSEMIDDRIEEGLSEEEAVANVGNIDEIVKQIYEEFPEREKEEKLLLKRKLNTLEIMLLIIGSPLWLSLLIVFYFVLWVGPIVLWSIEVPFYIFSYISKFLLIVCKEITKVAVKMTQSCLNQFRRIF